MSSYASIKDHLYYLGFSWAIKRACLHKVGWLSPPVILISLCLANEMVHWAKVLATESDDMHSVIRIHMVYKDICYDV